MGTDAIGFCPELLYENHGRCEGWTDRGEKEEEEEEEVSEVKWKVKGFMRRKGQGQDRSSQVKSSRGWSKSREGATRRQDGNDAGEK